MFVHIDKYIDDRHICVQTDTRIIQVSAMELREMIQRRSCNLLLLWSLLIPVTQMIGLPRQNITNQNIFHLNRNKTQGMAFVSVICESCYAGGQNGFTSEPGCNYPSFNQETLTTESWQRCQMHCSPQPHCKVWTWDQRYSRCYVKYAIGSPACHTFLPHEFYSGRRCQYVSECKVDYSCDFTQKLCQWSNDDSADFKWAVHRGRMVDQGDFSPPGDHTSGASGWYAVADTTIAPKINSIARLKSPPIPASRKSCFQFWYHMYGPSVGKLSVYTTVKDGGQRMSRWAKSGTVGPHWRHQTIEISSDAEYYLYIEAVIPKIGPVGVIALDDFDFSDGGCPPSDECTFEDKDKRLCGWEIQNSPSSWMGGTWTRKQALYTIGTHGIDHTYGTKYGCVLEAKGQNYGKLGYFMSKDYPPTKGRCLSFWYVMRIPNEEIVVVMEANGKITNLWRSSFISYSWRQATVTITSSLKYKIKFVSVNKPNTAHIDDILIIDGRCEPEGSCNFERGLCSYLNSENDHFDWLIGSGDTTSNDGPSVDHTDGTAFGQYIFIAPSSKEIHDMAIISSEGIQVPGNNRLGKCISFWYFMVGKTAGSLQVQIIVSGTSTLWSLHGEQNKGWVLGKAPLISRGKSFAVNFVGVRGLDDKGKLAIDDIKMTDYDATCSISPATAQTLGCNFEHGRCGWSDVSDQGLHWQQTNTSTLSNVPPSDHTIGKPYTNAGCWKYSSTIPSLEGTDKRLVGNYKKRRYAVSICYQVAYEKGFNCFVIKDNGMCCSSANACNVYRDKGTSYSCNNGKGYGTGMNVYYGYGAGQFMYADISWTGVNRTADLVSPPIIPTLLAPYQPYCLSFFYFQKAILRQSALEVYTKNGDIWQPILWKADRRTITQWIPVEVQLNVAPQDQVVIRAVPSEHASGAVSIDDIDITYGDCSKSGSCSFENPNICGWHVIGSETKWKRKSPSTISGSIGPGTDHTYNTKYGHFMFLNATESRYSSYLKKEFTVQSDSCFRFYYYIDLNPIYNMASLRVKVSYLGIHNYGFEAYGVHKSWNLGQISIKNLKKFQVQVEGMVFGKGYVIMGFDDVSIEDGVCPPLGNCNFEHGFCSWEPDMDDGGYNWLIGRGGLSRLGPPVDHTLNSTGGYYIYIDSSKMESDTTAVIESVEFEATKGKCMSFWYYMRGKSVQSLSIYIKYISGVSSKRLLWTLSGEQAHDWLFGRLPISSDKNFRILIQGDHQHLYEEYIAIDDIKFFIEDCTLFPSHARPVIPTSISPTLLSTTPAFSGADCHFEHNGCPFWTSSGGDYSNWVRIKGEEDARVSGPHDDHTTDSATGHYIYVNVPKSSMRNGQHDQAWLQSGSIANKNGGCFEFWYHMHGMDVGVLTVSLTIKGSYTPQWFRTGSQEDRWRVGQVYIDPSDGPAVKIRFGATHLQRSSGDISLDDFALIENQKCQWKVCTLEEGPNHSVGSGLPCGWSNDPMAWPWRVIEPIDIHSSRAPKRDHTLNSSSGHYLYFEHKLNLTNSIGINEAVMTSQWYNRTIGECFSFWYIKQTFSSNRSEGTLSVFQELAKGDISRLWHSDDINSQWRRALIPIHTRDDDYRIVMHGLSIPGNGDLSQVGNNVTNIFAIDDIEKFGQECPLPGDCDFEQYVSCDYVQSENDESDWIRARGSTGERGTGPEYDHTRGPFDRNGHYYFINATTMKTGDKAELISRIFPSTNPDIMTGRCLQFYRHMLGDGIGRLNIYILQPGASKILVWSISGNEGKSWSQSQVPIDSPYSSFQLIFEAVKGDTNQGDIAIDDISFNSYAIPCSYIPIHAEPDQVIPTPTTPSHNKKTRGMSKAAVIEVSVIVPLVLIGLLVTVVVMRRPGFQNLFQNLFQNRAVPKDANDFSIDFKVKNKSSANDDKQSTGGVGAADLRDFEGSVNSVVVNPFGSPDSFQNDIVNKAGSVVNPFFQDT